MSRAAMKAIATFLGAGFFPKAPGTFATLATIPLYLITRRLSLPLYLAFIGKLFAAGVLASGSMEKEWGKDPSRVVIDEVCGLLVTLIERPAGFKEIALGTALFRFFDIVKPPPVGTLDRKLKGGLGIMADDIAAGILAALVLHVIRRRGWLS
ncbi:MAG TPA: phosphatidylglycerophosphatase A [Deltaproteobacteria bacterium]|nr:phosphatidylglycerophosphatase A [Deltaproteobacteria bacterium]HPR55516.1 phosphatidylglycerophosphatase A [Deltaproteobacteria bacterium]HXK48753.1 phosphatidylglycerophosphatase A [Deltaproteobacteria bacterium]